MAHAKSTVGIVLEGLVVREVTPGSPAHTTRALIMLPASPRARERDGERECFHKNGDADRIQPGDVIIAIDGSEVNKTVSLRESFSSPLSSSTPTLSPHKPTYTSSLRRHALVAEGLIH